MAGARIEGDVGRIVKAVSCGCDCGDHTARCYADKTAPGVLGRVQIAVGGECEVVDLNTAESHRHGSGPVVAPDGNGDDVLGGGVGYVQCLAPDLQSVRAGQQ